IVMTPSFLGSEPVVAESGKHAGVRVFEAEETNGLALMQALTAEQRAKATIGDGPPYAGLSHAFRDNIQVQAEGIRYDELSAEQQALLWRLVETYVGYM